jgi:hypothetical protein
MSTSKCFYPCADPTLLSILNSILTSLRQLTIIKADITTLNGNLALLNTKTQTNMNLLKDSLLSEIADVERVTMEHGDAIKTELQEKLDTLVNKLNSDINDLKMSVLMVDKKHDVLIEALQDKHAEDMLSIQGEFAVFKAVTESNFHKLQQGLQDFANTLSSISF